MADDIIERFFEGVEKFMPLLGIEVAPWQRLDHFEATTDSCPAQQLLRIWKKIIHERLRRVIRRVDGPNDLVQ